MLRIATEDELIALQHFFRAEWRADREVDGYAISKFCARHWRKVVPSARLLVRFQPHTSGIEIDHPFSITTVAELKEDRSCAELLRMVLF